MTTVETAIPVLESLELYGESCGDPTDAAYRRFYALHPEAVEELAFDHGIEERMMSGILALITDVADGSRAPDHSMYWISDHVAWDVTETMIRHMFEVIRDEIRDGAGTGWTSEMDDAWTELLAALAPAVHEAVGDAGGATED